MANFCAVCRKYFITSNFLFAVPDKTSGIKYSAERHALWMAAINRKDLGADSVNVCSKHFVSGKPAEPLDRQDIDWVPTVNLGRKRRREIDDFCIHVSKVAKVGSVPVSDEAEQFERQRQQREANFQVLIKAEMERDEYFAKLEEEFAKQNEKKPEPKEVDSSDDDDTASTDGGNKYSMAINSYVDRLESLNRRLERELDHLRQETALLYDVYNFRLLNCITRRSLYD